MKKIDLHIHTHYSDGIHSVEETFELAKKAGIEVLAITDHNWHQHIKNNAEIAKKHGLDYVQGIEISSLFEGKTVHILGYSKSFDFEKLGAGLDKLIKGYDQRARQIVENINTNKTAKIDYEDMTKKFKGCIMNFPIQIELGKSLKMAPLDTKLEEIYKKHIEPFGDWLVKPEEAVDIIHKSRGIAILAHPAVAWRKLGKESFDRLMATLMEAGIDGLEASHSEQSEAEEKEIVELAKKHDLIITGGSDFHGLEVHPHRKIGEKGLTRKQYEKILKRLDCV